MYVYKILYVETDKETITYEELSKYYNYSDKELWTATLIITSKGQILKSRYNFEDNNLEFAEMIENNIHYKRSSK